MNAEERTISPAEATAFLEEQEKVARRLTNFDNSALNELKAKYAVKLAKKKGSVPDRYTLVQLRKELKTLEEVERDYIQTVNILRGVLVKNECLEQDLKNRKVVTKTAVILGLILGCIVIYSVIISLLHFGYECEC